MSKQDNKDAPDHLPANEETVESQPLEEVLREQFGEVRGASERRNVAGLVREIGQLPADRARAALEVSVGLANLSLRVGLEFLRAAAGAAQVLAAAELREWGEMGRRLAMADVETGINFFRAGVAELHEVPNEARPLLFQVCARQLPLSTSIALETFERAPELARAAPDDELLAATFEVALEIARRSARHSADFLAASFAAFAHLKQQYGETKDGGQHKEVARAALHLAGVFAQRAGGVASDAWTNLPAATAGLDAAQALALFRHTETFLERGGAAALHVLVAGGEVLRLAPQVFADWTALLHAVAAQGNAPLVSLARHSPLFFRALPSPQEARFPRRKRRALPRRHNARVISRVV